MIVIIKIITTIIIIIIIISSLSSRTSRESHLRILGAQVLEGRAADNVLKDKIATLDRSIKRLSTLQSHDAL